jgi:probable HAF family extracellular repeat protein
MTNVRQLTAAVLFALVALPLASAQKYTITDLGTLSGTQSFATSVNSAGAVAGSATVDPDIFTHAFIWTKTGGISDLGTLGGDLSIGNALSGTGAVVGGSQTAGDFTFHAFIYTSALLDVGTLGGDFSNATGVNDAGQVVGSSTLAGEASTHAFYWDARRGMKDLGTLGGTNSQASAIGSEGVAVGGADLGDGVTSNAVYWDHKGIHDIGNLGGGSALALGVNEGGTQIVGQSIVASGDTHGFLYLKKTHVMRDLGTLGGTQSQANAISPEDGLVVGTSTDAGDVNSLAFLWTPRKGMVDLNTKFATGAGAGWTLQTANSVNTKGQIAGTGALNGATHAFLLTPVNN